MSKWPSWFSLLAGVKPRHLLKGRKPTVRFGFLSYLVSEREVTGRVK